MQDFTSFRSLDFLEQAALLQTVRDELRLDALDELLPLLAAPLEDSALSTMIRASVRVLLAADEQRLLACLASDNVEARLLAAHLAGERAVKAARPRLTELAGGTGDPNELLTYLSALAALRDPASLPAFRKHFAHPDPFVAALCLEMAGELGDSAAIPVLCKAIDANGAEDRYTQCEITAWKAVKALAALGNDEALGFLAHTIHHRNPTLRRIIHEALTQAGPAAVVHVEAMLRQGDADEKIMAANVLGAMGHKSGADALIRAMDDGLPLDVNLVFAVYEALGAIPCLKSLVFLLDGLEAAKDEALRLALVVALDKQAGCGVCTGADESIRKRFSALGEHGPDILRAVVAARASRLSAVFLQDPAMAQALADTAAAHPDRQAVESLRSLLISMGSPLAASLEAPAEAAPSLRLLAVDDSSAMRVFYANAGAALGFAVRTAEHGRSALDILDKNLAEKGPAWDLLIIDMNMPVMDGIELTRRVRSLPGLENTPILMASTESEASQKTLAHKAGVTAFLTKPFTLDALQDMMTKVCQ